MQYQQSKQQTLASNYWAQKRPWYTTLEIHIFLVWDRYNCFTYMRYRLIEPKHRRSIIVLIVTNQYLRPTILFYKICNLHKWTTPDLRVVIIKWLTMVFFKRDDVSLSSLIERRSPWNVRLLRHVLEFSKKTSLIILSLW